MHVPVSCCLSAAGVGFMVILCPLGSWAFLTVGLPVPDLGPDPNGVVTLRTHEMRPGWVPSVPRGLRYPHGWRDSPAAARRLSTAGPYTPVLRPIAGAYSNEASPRVHRCSPVRPSPHL